jgi:hypothetical protein
MVLFYFMSWIYSWNESLGAQATSYIRKDEKPNEAVVQACVLSPAVLGFSCVLVLFCESFLCHIDASLGLCFIEL